MTITFKPGFVRLKRSAEVEARDSVGHDHVGKKQVDLRPASFPDRDRLGAVGGLDHPVAELLEAEAGHSPDGLLVLDEKNRLPALRGALHDRGRLARRPGPPAPEEIR